jgi:hypothetical protein
MHAVVSVLGTVSVHTEAIERLRKSQRRHAVTILSERMEICSRLNTGVAQLTAKTFPISVMRLKGRYAWLTLSRLQTYSCIAPSDFALF